MSISQQLIHHEGLRLKPYRCTAGKLSIGVGHNLDDNPLTAEQCQKIFGRVPATGEEVQQLLTRDGITREQALHLLDDDLAICRRELARGIGFYSQLDETRKNVLIDMCFNIGISRLKGFRKMLAAVEAGDYARAAAEMMDSRWADQVGRRADTLAEMMKRGA